jgi:hypothetical protein
MGCQCEAIFSPSAHFLNYENRIALKMAFTLAEEY